MTYVSLYRRYRPHTFSDIVGQEHVTTTLQNAIREDRLHHAYLFTGPRGTGKTSIARILAMAVNAAEGPTPDPDPDDEVSVEIREGRSVDVIELDMASHGGVDDARELRDRALFAPARLRKKVYILDEVHMASQAAFNALLKLIEEPPGHVLFAMATTDPQKVIPTIMSRVQRLDLRRVAAPKVAAHIREVASAEGFSLEDGAVDAIVRAGDGSVRDTLSVLEQVLAFSGDTVTTDQVAQVLGTTPVERTVAAVEHIARSDLAGAMALVHGLLDDGHDLRRFALDLLQHLRDLLVLQVAPDRPDLVDATDERRAIAKTQSELLPQETLTRAVDILGATLTDMRQGPARLPLELALAKITLPAAGGDVGALADRVSRIESQLARGARAAVDPAHPPAPEPPRTEAVSEQEPADVRDARDTDAGAGDAGDADAAVAREEVADEPASAPAPPEAPEPPEAPGPPEATAAVPEPPPAPEPDKPPPAPESQTAPASAAVAAVDEPPAAPEAAEEPAPPPSSEDRDTAPAAPESTGDEKADDDRMFDAIRSRWPAVLEILRDGSKRIHAVYERAEPVRFRRGVLTLSYPTRYKSFHAQHAVGPEYAAALQDALKRSVGLEHVRVGVAIDGEVDDRPQPPVVTPADATLPSEEPPAEEQADVREAEMEATPVDPDTAAATADELVRTQLGGTPIDEDA